MLLAAAVALLGRTSDGYQIGPSVVGRTQQRRKLREWVHNPMRMAPLRATDDVSGDAESFQATNDKLKVTLRFVASLLKEEQTQRSLDC